MADSKTTSRVPVSFNFRTLLKALKGEFHQVCKSSTQFNGRDVNKGNK